MTVEILLAIAFGGAFITYFLSKVAKRAGEVFAVVVSLALVAIVASFYDFSSSEVFNTGFMGFPLVLKMNTLSWFFAITITIVGTLSVIFSLSYIRGRERTDFYYLMLLLINASMVGIVVSGDLVSFYIFWEIMSWSTFLLISYNRGPALNAGMKYIIMSVTGSVAMLVGILSLYSHFGTLVIAELSGLMSATSPGYILFVFILFLISFGIKNAICPFHPWLPSAHSEAPSPFSAVLSGTIIKMGAYGFLLLFYVIIGLKKFLGLGVGVFSLHYFLCWLGAITVVIPTFIALLQNDAKRLLAWHSIGQVGYIMLGIAFGTSLGVAGGIFHILNHATFKALLFLTVGAIEYRTGTRDLNSLGGFIKTMPITFIGALVGALGIMGIPLTNGFVSKWLIYKTLILNGKPFLAFAALVGTWGTILSLFKFVHNIFLGQLPEKYKDVKKAPFSMQLPIMVFSFIIILFGVLPGIPLKVINKIIVSFGLDSLNINIWGIASETGALNTINIFAAIVATFLVVWFVLKVARKSKRVEQENNYAAGAAVPVGKYHYTADFYGPLYKIITPYLRDFIDDLYMSFARGIQNLCGVVRRIYTGEVGFYVMYIILFLAAIIFAQIKWSIW